MRLTHYSALPHSILRLHNAESLHISQLKFTPTYNPTIEKDRDSDRAPKCKCLSLTSELTARLQQMLKFQGVRDGAYDWNSYDLLTQNFTLKESITERRLQSKNARPKLA